MQPQGQTSKAYFTLLTILHGALLGTQLIFAIAVYYVNTTSPLAGDDAANLNEVFQFIVPGLMLASYIGGSILVKTQLNTLKAKTTLSEKLLGYRALLLMRFALLEIPSLFSIVCFVLTSNYLYLGLAGLIMLVFMLNRPTRYRAVNDLELTPPDRALLENPDAVVV